MRVRGHVDGMIGTYVSGWAVAEPDLVPCDITVIDAKGTLLAKSRASRDRADLVVLGLGSTSFSFRVPVDNPPERRLLRVLANGFELPGSPFATGGGLFDAECSVTRGIVRGRITERVTASQPPTITVVDQHGLKVGEAAAVLDMEEDDRLAAKARFDIDLDDHCFGAGELRLSVLANLVKFAECTFEPRLAGNLEVVTAERCCGWLLSPDQPGRAFAIEVRRDGVLVGTAVCDGSREDVRAHHPGSPTPGFFIDLPKPTHDLLEPTTISLRLRNSAIELFEGPYVIGGQAAAVVAAQRAARLAHVALPGIGAAERAVIQLALGQFLAGVRRDAGFTASRQLLPAPNPAVAPRLTIIMPVYRGLAVTAACIDAVLAHRDPSTDHLLLVNDASPQPEMAKLLHDYTGHPNVFLLTNERNGGFIKAVNRGLGFAAAGDVLLLNADTLLFPGGLDELCRIAQAAPEIGTVTAMSNNATIFSYPHPSRRQEFLLDISWPELAAAALNVNAGLAVDVPTGHGFCLLIKADLRRRIGLFNEDFGRGYGEENDFCQRAADLGYRHVAAAGVIVEHRESVSFIGEKASLLAANLPRLDALYPEFTPLVMEFERRDGLRPARWGLDSLRLRRAVAAGARFVLIVSNMLDGGTAKAIEDIGRAADHYGGAAELHLRARADGLMELLCERPDLHAVFAAAEIDQLFQVLGSAEPCHVLVHQLLGYPAAFIARLGEWAAELHTVYHAHDFYPICPRVTMIDAVDRFCGVADTATCARCVAIGGAQETSKLNELTPAAHRQLFAELLRGFRHVVTPSANTASLLRQVFPELEIQAVRHPEPSEGVAPAPRGGGEEVVLLGAIGPHKGSGKLLEIAQRARLTHPQLRFRVIGFTDIDRQLAAIGNVSITGRYRPEQLPELIGLARGRLALFLHAWPETYSYTVSEAARHGLIPLVPDLGAPAERVREAGFGAVFPSPVSAEQVLGLIDDILAGRVRAHAEDAAPARLFPTLADFAMTRRIYGIEDMPAAPALATDDVAVLS